MDDDRGIFLRATCTSCGNEQLLFSKPAADVACHSCGDILAESRGGIAHFNAQLEVVS